MFGGELLKIAGNIAWRSLQITKISVLREENFFALKLKLSQKWSTFSSRNTNVYKKMANFVLFSTKGYILRILQHFPAKLCNSTNPFSCGKRFRSSF